MREFELFDYIKGYFQASNKTNWGKNELLKQLEVLERDWLRGKLKETVTKEE